LSCCREHTAVASTAATANGGDSGGGDKKEASECRAQSLPLTTDDNTVVCQADNDSDKHNDAAASDNTDKTGTAAAAAAGHDDDDDDDNKDASDEDFVVKFAVNDDAEAVYDELSDEKLSDGQSLIDTRQPATVSAIHSQLFTLLHVQVTTVLCTPPWSTSFLTNSWWILTHSCARGNSNEYSTEQF